MVLLLDTETTGLDFQNDRVIEIAAMVTDDDFGEAEESMDFFCYAEGYPEISPEITKITGITQMDMKNAVSFDHAITRIHLMGLHHGCTHVVAYNADFDRQMVAAELERLKYGAWEIPWLCAMRDLESNQDFKCKKLSHLALDRGIKVDPATLHRAMGDVELMRKMLREAGASVKTLRDYRDVPYVYVAAKVAHPREPKSEMQRKTAKEFGYNWEQARGDFDGPRFEKRWVKRIKQNEWEKEQSICPLQLSLI